MDGVRLIELTLPFRHGPLSDCPIQIAERLVIEYTKTTEASSVRETMERRYGRKNLKRLVAKYKEDRANREWLEKSTKACPGCRVHVEKSMGCNHVRNARAGFGRESAHQHDR
jgi:E3 ubiquitin-protein ligase RNF14